MKPVHGAGPWLTLGLTIGLSVAACGASSSPAAGAEQTRAEVELEIDAEPAVVRSCAALRLRLSSLPELPAAGEMIGLEEPQRSIVYDVFTWPQTLTLPDDLLRAGDAFWVEAAALDVTGRELTTTRLISTQLEDRRLHPSLLLRDRCLDVICGSRSSSCDEAGFCGSAIRAAEGLPNEPLN